MKLLSLTLAAFVILAFAPCSIAAGDAKPELQTLVTKVRAKIGAGKTSEQDLADELKEFDTLLDEHKGEKTDDVAQILYMKASIYSEILDDTEKATGLLNQLKTDFPDTKRGKDADEIIAQMQAQEAGKKIFRTLVVGSRFPDFDEKDVEGKPVSIANYKGKLVLLDFWATWCGPCVGELPNVLKTYGQYHDKGLEIIGISLDLDKTKLTDFTKEKKMPWQQYCDGGSWNSKLARKYGIESIPSTFLLDKDGIILARDLRGEALDAAVAKGLQ